MGGCSRRGFAVAHDNCRMASLLEEEPLEVSKIQNAVESMRTYPCFLERQRRCTVVEQNPVR